MARLSIDQKLERAAKEEEQLRQAQERLNKKKSEAKRQQRILQKEKKAQEDKARAHRLIVIGGAVESVLGRPISEEDVDLLIAFLKDQDRRGNFFTKAMTRKNDVSSEKALPDASSEDI